MEHKLTYLLYFVLAVFLVLLGKVFLQGSFIDFAVYYDAAMSVLNGGSMYLAADPNMSYLYAPLTISIFLPFTFLPMLVAGKLWVLTSLCLFAIAWYLLCNHQHIALGSRLGIVLSIAICLFFPFKFTMAMGQINMVTFFLLVFFFLFYNKNKYLSGIFLTLAVYIKISPILFILYLGYRKEWRILYAVLITSLLLAIGSVFIYPLETKEYITTVLPTLTSAWPTGYYNQSLTGFLGRLLPHETLVHQLRYGGVLLIIGLTGYSFIFSKSKKQLVEMSSIIPVMLLISSFSWQHHFVMLLISYVIVLAELRSQRYSTRFTYTLFFFMVISFLLVGYNIKQPELVPVIFQSHVFYGTVVLWILQLVMIQKKYEKTIS